MNKRPVVIRIISSSTEGSMKNTALRSPKTFERYLAKPKEDGCFICKAEAVEEYKHWKIIWNDYPYDAVASRHYMLVPIKHVPTRSTVSQDARKELESIMAQLEDSKRYDSILENFHTARTNTEHFHFHILKWRRM